VRPTFADTVVPTKSGSTASEAEAPPLKTDEFLILIRMAKRLLSLDFEFDVQPDYGLNRLAITRRRAEPPSAGSIGREGIQIGITCGFDQTNARRYAVGPYGELGDGS
jgi:hypothetical protein